MKAFIRVFLTAILLFPVIAVINMLLTIVTLIVLVVSVPYLSITLSMKTEEKYQQHKREAEEKEALSVDWSVKFLGYNLHSGKYDFPIDFDEEEETDEQSSNIH